jgi:hypothetical protein
VERRRRGSNPLALFAIVKDGARIASRDQWEGIMPTILPRKRYRVALLSIALAGFAGAARAEDLSSYMAPIGGRTSSSAAETATKDVLALNTMMFPIVWRVRRDFPQEPDG